jgi:hypothetical protein
MSNLISFVIKKFGQNMDFEIINLSLNVLIAIGGVYLIFFKSYFKEKGKNLATKEDIGVITTKIEEVKTIYEKKKIKFDYFHRKQAKVLGEIYSLLVDAVDSMYSLTVPFKFADAKTVPQRMEDASNKLTDLRECYKKNKIYFSKEIIDRFEFILSEMVDSYGEYDISQLKEIEINEKSKYIKSAFGKIEKTAIPLYEEIENLFRKILNEEGD